MNLSAEKFVVFRALSLLCWNFLKSVSPQYFDRYGSFQIKLFFCESFVMAAAFDEDEMEALVELLDDFQEAIRLATIAARELRSLRSRLGWARRRVASNSPRLCGCDIGCCGGTTPPRLERDNVVAQLEDVDIPAAVAVSEAAEARVADLQQLIEGVLQNWVHPG